MARSRRLLSGTSRSSRPDSETRQGQAGLGTNGPALPRARSPRRPVAGPSQEPAAARSRADLIEALIRLRDRSDSRLDRDLLARAINELEELQEPPATRVIEDTPAGILRTA